MADDLSEAIEARGYDPEPVVPVWRRKGWDSGRRPDMGFRRTGAGLMGTGPSILFQRNINEPFRRRMPSETTSPPW